MNCTLAIVIPFTLGRCDYLGRPLWHDVAPATKHAYLDALLAEARTTCPDIAAAGETVNEIVFCGGSLGTVEPDRLHTLLREIARVAPLAPGCRISAEVDPGLVSTALVGELRMGGLAHLRFRYLTSDALESELLGRPCAAVEMAKTRIVMDAAGFHDFDMQVLVGFAGQTEKTLLRTLRDAVLIEGVTHCTLLTAQGALAMGAAQAGKLYGIAADFLADHGFEGYAPGRFARAGGRLSWEESRFAERAVVGLGVGASSRLGGLAWENVRDLDAYMRAEGTAALLTARITEIDADARAERARQVLDQLWRLKPQATPSTGTAEANGDSVSTAELDAACGSSAPREHLVRAGLLEAAELGGATRAEGARTAGGAAQAEGARKAGGAQSARRLCISQLGCAHFEEVAAAIAGEAQPGEAPATPSTDKAPSADAAPSTGANAGA